MREKPSRIVAEYPLKNARFLRERVFRAEGLACGEKNFKKCERFPQSKS